jgi:phage protein D
MTTASSPGWDLEYEGVDIGDDAGTLVTDVTYTDDLHAVSDEVELTVADPRALWRGPWYPSQGDRIGLSIRYTGQPVLRCGQFEVDEPELAGPPDVVRVRGLAAGISAPLRTRLSRAFEQLSVADIVAQVARGLGMSLVGSPPTRVLRRVTQSHEDTLTFLQRLAEDYGYCASVRGGRLCFVSLAELEAAPPVAIIDRQDLTRYSFRHRSHGTYQACEVSYQDPESGETLRRRVSAQDAAPASPEVLLGAAGQLVSDPLATTDGVRAWQRFLAGLGVYGGAVDGVINPALTRATRLFQAARGLVATGLVDAPTRALAEAIGWDPSAGDLRRSPAAADVLRVEVRVESEAEAEDKARAFLYRANRQQTVGRLSLPGNTLLVSGVTFMLAGMARLSGKYIVERSRHRLNRSGGYGLELEVTRV